MPNFEYRVMPITQSQGGNATVLESAIYAFAKDMDGGWELATYLPRLAEYGDAEAYLVFKRPIIGREPESPVVYR